MKLCQSHFLGEEIHPDIIISFLYFSKKQLKPRRENAFEIPNIANNAQKNLTFQTNQNKYDEDE